MKNEDKIVEILAESLKKQDRQEELLSKLVDSHSELLDSHAKHGKILEKLVDGQERLIDQFHKMNDHLLMKQEKLEDRVVRLEDKVFKS